MDDSVIQLWVESLFVFSVVWSVGATGDTEGREAFDAFFRCVLYSTQAAQAELHRDHLHAHVGHASAHLLQSADLAF